MTTFAPGAGRTIYVAEPIDQSDGGSWKASVEAVLDIIIKRGWLAYRPAGAWRLKPGVEVGPEIEGVNRYVLTQSRAMVAFLPRGVATVGVPREIEWAVGNGIPVAVVTDYAASWALHDVDVFEFDDLPGIGQWIVAAESPDATGVGVAFSVGPHGTLPTRSNDGDAGYDLYVSRTVTIPPGEFVDVECDIRVALPPGVWARITGRSSTLRKRSLLVSEGIIDTGYRGPLYSGVMNLGEDPQTVEVGDRISQLIFHDNLAPRFTPTVVDGRYFDRIPGDTRGDAGFGSTGT